MIKLQQQDTKTLVTVHGWSGVIIGLLLYIVICTGVAAVFAREIGNWSSPLGHSSESGFAPGLGQKIQELAREVDPQFYEEIAIFESAGGRLLALFHKHEKDADGKPFERGVEFEMDPRTWQVLERREGRVDEQIAEQRSANAIANFFVELHVRLHVPDPYGLILTGILGLGMMIAAVTGLFIHRHLIKDLFTLRFYRDAILRRRDLHVVAGSWNLPFAFILAFTGSFFSFAGSVGIPAVAMVVFNGNQEAMIEALTGGKKAEDPRPAPLGNLDAMIADAKAQSGGPTFVVVDHFGRADASVRIFVKPRENELIGSNYLYSGVSGAPQGEQPVFGTTPSFGASLIGLMGPLHFGNFAGAVSKAVWVGLGAAGAYVTFTGMLLWTRRRAEQPAWQRIERTVYYVGYGLPLALIVAPYAFFLMRGRVHDLVMTQTWVFLVAALIIGVASFVIKDLERLRRGLLACTGIAMLGLPVLRLMTGGMPWDEAVAAGTSAVIAIDCVLVILGAACLWAAMPKRVREETDDGGRSRKSSREHQRAGDRDVIGGGPAVAMERADQGVATTATARDAIRRSA